MKFLNTELGTIQKRYKRFLSDITLYSGEKIHAHVPNTGKMDTCLGDNWKVLVSKSDNPNRKLPYTLECTHNGKTWISVNTARTNKLVHEAIENNVISETHGYKSIQAEKKIYDSRIDFFLSGHDLKSDMYIEVKNATLSDEKGTSMFPDAVSTRGQKHIEDLIKIKKSGLEAAMIYVVNREDVNVFTTADDVDPQYSKLLKEAYDLGVKVLAYQTKITTKEIKIVKRIEVKL